jgi:hypothetical protein
VPGRQPRPSLQTPHRFLIRLTRRLLANLKGATSGFGL